MEIVYILLNENWGICKYQVISMWIKDYNPGTEYSWHWFCVGLVKNSWTIILQMQIVAIFLKIDFNVDLLMQQRNPWNLLLNITDNAKTTVLVCPWLLMTARCYCNIVYQKMSYIKYTKYIYVVKATQTLFQGRVIKLNQNKWYPILHNYKYSEYSSYLFNNDL